MAYTPNEWACGETITAEKLNKLERGVQSIMSDYVPTVWQCGDVITAERLNKLEQAVADFECGGGEGYLGIHTATVNVTFDTSEVEGEITGIISAYITLYSGDNGAVNFAYSSGAIPTAELGSPAQMLIPISDTYPAVIDSSSLGWEINDSAVMIAEATVVSGSATGAIVSGGSGAISITGDCILNIKVMYQD